MLEHTITPPRSGPARGPGARYALVLHGVGDSMHGWRPVVDELALPPLGYVFANAPDPYIEGYSWFPIPGFTDPEASYEATLTGMARSRELLRELIVHLESDLALSSDQLVLLGFSQGCAMALDVGLRHQTRFAGIVALSGFVGPVEEYPAAFGAAAREQRLFWTHGRQDPVIDFRRAKSEMSYLGKQGLKIDWREYDKPHTVDPQRELPELRAWLQERIAVAGSA